jgi:hypothetical protein
MSGSTPPGSRPGRGAGRSRRVSGVYDAAIRPARAVEPPPCGPRAHPDRAAIATRPVTGARDRACCTRRFGAPNAYAGRGRGNAASSDTGDRGPVAGRCQCRPDEPSVPARPRRPGRSVRAGARQQRRRAPERPPSTFVNRESYQHGYLHAPDESPRLSERLADAQTLQCLDVSSMPSMSEPGGNAY